MEKDRTAKVLAVLALVVATVGISIGFAAFSSVLTISPSATVRPSDEDFKVQFSSDSSKLETNAVTGVPSGTGSATAEEATIDNDSDSGPTITNLKANFTEPGQTVTYTFYARNDGMYDAHLKSVTFGNVAAEKLLESDFTGQEGKKFCIPSGDTDKDMVSDACDDITIKVSIGEAESAPTTQDLSVDQVVSDHVLSIGDSEKIVVTINYAKTGENGKRANGDFTVEFGDITLTYSAVE